jgi:hypothetical protein
MKKTPPQKKCDEDAQRQVAAQPVQAGDPDEVDDDAEIGELERQPDVGAAGPHLESAAQPFDEVQYCGIDVRHPIVSPAGVSPDGIADGTRPVAV